MPIKVEIWKREFLKEKYYFTYKYMEEFDPYEVLIANILFDGNGLFVKTKYVNKV